jgi:hypothetical protein
MTLVEILRCVLAGLQVVLIFILWQVWDAAHFIGNVMETFTGRHDTSLRSLRSLRQMAKSFRPARAGCCAPPSLPMPSDPAFEFIVAASLGQRSGNTIRNWVNARFRFGRRLRL